MKRVHKTALFVLLFILLTTIIFMVINKKNNEEKKFIGKVTFIELGSKNCIDCIKMEKVTDEIKKEFKDKINYVFYDVNTDEDYDKAEKYKINLIPNQVFFDKYGKEYYRHVGYLSKEEVRKIILSGLEIK